MPERWKSQSEVDFWSSAPESGQPLSGALDHTPIPMLQIQSNHNIHCAANIAPEPSASARRYDLEVRPRLVENLDRFAPMFRGQVGIAQCHAVIAVAEKLADGVEVHGPHGKT